MNARPCPRNQARLHRKCCSKSFEATKTRAISTTFLAVLFAFAPSFVEGQVIISEFLYDAEGSDTDREYVELFNAGTAPVDLTKWKISDGSNHTLNAPPKNGGVGSITLSPGAYALLVDSAADFIPLHSGVGGTIIDTVLSLPNASGAIVLIDGEGATSDSVSYDKNQGGAGDGNALARTSVSGTAFSAATPTPGRGPFATASASSPNSGGGSDTAKIGRASCRERV